MKKTYLILFFFLLSKDISAQFQWHRCLGGSYIEEGHVVHQTNDGGYILAGMTYSNDGDVTRRIASFYDFDYWVVKMTSTGNIQWQRALGGSNQDVAHSIQQTSDGGYIVAGGSWSNDGDVSGHHLEINPAYPDPDFWIVKLSPTGDIQWQKSLGGSDYDNAWSIAQTSDRGYIVAGNTRSSDGDASANNGGPDWWVVKLASDGNIQWEKNIGGSEWDEAFSIQQVMDGGYIVSGLSSSNDGDITVNPNGNLVVKLSSAGDIEWQKAIGIAGENSVRQTTDGGYIAISYNPATYTPNAIKLSSIGDIQWTTSLDNKIGNANSITPLSDGNYIVAGWSQSPANFSAIKLLSSGEVKWEKNYCCIGSNEPQSILPTSDSGYIAIGNAKWNGFAVDDYRGGFSDIWVVKMASCVLSPTILFSEGILSTTATYAGYQWTLNETPIPGATNSTYIVTGHGIYGVNVTDTAHKCFGSATYNFTNSINRIYPISICTLPNPTTGTISITGANNTTIKVYNTIGQLIASANNTDQISISEVPAGLYFVQVFNEQGELLKQEKVIKQ